MRFQVPQFIEVEDKIFGPLTLKQFIYLAGGGGLSFVVYAFTNSLLVSALPIIVIMSVSAALAFYKINKRPLILVLESAFKYYIGNKLYLWKKENKAPTATPDADTMSNYSKVIVPKIAESKLKDLTWSLDVQESIYSKESQK